MKIQIKEIIVFILFLCSYFIVTALGIYRNEGTIIVFDYSMFGIISLCVIISVVDYIFSKRFFSTKKIDNGSDEVFNELDNLTTELRERDLELQRTEFKFKNLSELMGTVINTLPEYIWAKDLNGVYKIINECASRHFFGLEPHDVIGKRDQELKSKSIYQEILISNDNNIPQHRPYVFKLEERGEVLEVFKSSFKDYTGKIIGIVGSARDITMKTKALKEIQTKDKIMTSISFIAERLLKLSNWDDEFNELLGRLGKSVEVERVCFFRREKPYQRDYKFILDAEWTKDRSLSHEFLKSVNRFSLSLLFPRWLMFFKRSKPIVGKVIDFPEEEQFYLDKRKILSTATFPIFINNVLYGFLSFDDCDKKREWSAIELKALRTAADILCAAIKQRKYDEISNKTINQMTQIFKSLHSGVILLDSETYDVIEANPAAIKLMSGKSEPCINIKNDLENGKYFKNQKCSCVDQKTGKEKYCLRSFNMVNIGNKEFILLNLLDISDKTNIKNIIEEYEKHYRSFIESFYDVVFDIEVPTGKINYISPSVSEYTTGLDKHENVKDLLYDIVYENDFEIIEKYIDSLSKGIVLPSVEYRVKTLDGNIVWIEQINSPNFDNNVQVIGIKGICRDITSKKKREKDLHDTKQFLNTLIDTVPIPIYFKDKNRKYKICNKAFVDLCQINKEDIIGKSVEESLGYIDESIDFIKEKDDLLYSGKESFQEYEKVVYFPGDKKNHHMKFFRSSVLNVNNDIIGVIGVSIDNSKEKHLREILKFKNSLWKNIFDSSEIAIYVIDDDKNEIILSNSKFNKMFNSERVYDDTQFNENEINSNDKKIKTDLLPIILNYDVPIDFIIGSDGTIEKSKRNNIMNNDGFVDVKYGDVIYAIRKIKLNIDKKKFTIIRLEDMTEERKKEKQINKHIDVLERSFNSLSDIIHVVDTKFNIVYFNDEFKKWCEDKNNIVGNYLFSSFSFLSQNIRSEYEEVLRSRKSIVNSAKLYSDDGKRIKFKSWKIPIINDETGEVEYILTIIRFNEKK